ncbi:unnamed protein product, partial [Ectocarpus fasciculatus]
WVQFDPICVALCLHFSTLFVQVQELAKKTARPSSDLCDTLYCRHSGRNEIFACVGDIFQDLDFAARKRNHRVLAFSPRDSPSDKASVPHSRRVEHHRSTVNGYGMA